MSNYSLYNLSKYPQISILILNLEKESHLLNLTNNLINQTLKEIQILYLWNDEKKKINFNEIKKYSLIDERINFFEINQAIQDNIFQLIDKIKGKFTLVIDKIINFDEQKLESFYNYTKGKINNIFEFSIGTINLYLIKTKILII